MSTHDSFSEEPPRKQGMGSTAKVLIILGSIFGVCLLACCGGVAFFAYRAKDVFKGIAESMSNDPAIVRQRTGEIIHIEIPDEFVPMATFGMPMGVVSMKSVMYQRKGNPNSLLMISETNQPMPPGQDPRQHREAMLKGMRQGQQMGNLDISAEKSEEREFTINGEKVPFEFIKGSAHGVPSRKVTGIFAGRNGTVMFILVVAESEYDEDAVVKMIGSIRFPTADTSVMTDTDDGESEMPEGPSGDDSVKPAEKDSGEPDSSTE